MAVRSCTRFGCGEWVEGGGPCPAHRPKDDRPSASQRGYGARWRRTRARFLRAHARCEFCQEPATEAHHLDLAGPKGPRGHDPDNLQALCSTHHKAITARMQPGGWAA